MTTLLGVLIHNELIKALKYKPIRYLLASIPIVLSLSAFLTVNGNLLTFFQKISQSHNIWISFILSQVLLYSIFITVIINLAVQSVFFIETSNNTWKYLLSQPVPKSYHFLSKLFVGVSIAMIALTIALSTSIAISFAISAHYEKIKMNTSPPGFVLLLNLSLKFFTIYLMVVLLHSCLCLFVRKQSILLLLSIFLPLIGLFDAFKFIPYSWPFHTFWLAIAAHVQTGSWSPYFEPFESISLGLFLTTIIMLLLFRKKSYKYA